MGKENAQPIYCPIVVGRARYLEALSRLMELSSQGASHIAVVRGEAGIGKTRLIGEIRKQVALQNWLIVSGDCFEGDFNFPFAPIIDLFRRYKTAAGLPEAKQRLSDPALLKLLPELDWLTSSSWLPTELEAEKRQLFHAIWQTFSGMAQGRPTLILIEDLHWCDETSLEFLLYLARHLTAQPLLLMLSYRPDEVRSSLQHMLAELNRTRLVTEFHLEPLSQNDVEAMLRAILDQQGVNAEFLQTIVNLTDGNPFFIEEVLKTLSMADTHLPLDLTDNPLDRIAVPHTVKDIVQRRSQQLTPAAQRTLIAAAVAGRHFAFELLQDVLQCSQTELVDLTKELIAAQLLVEGASGELSFRHALIQQAIYYQPLHIERKTWHQKIGESLERQHSQPSQHLNELAYHFYNAGDWHKTFEYSRRAGQEAQALYSPRSTLQHFTHALEAAYQLGAQIPPGLYRERALAYQTIGDFENAQADFESAIRIAQTNRDAQEEWQASLDLGLLWTGRDYSQTGQYYQRALSIARSLNELPMIGTSLNRLGNWHMNVEQPREALRYHQEALALFEQFNFELGIAETLMFLGYACVFTGNAIQAASSFARAADVFRKYDIRVGLVYALGGMTLTAPVHVSDTLIPASTSLHDAIQKNETALRLAREMNWRAGEAFILVWLAICTATLGDYGQALNYARTASDICEQIGNREYACSAEIEQGFIYLELFAYTRARAHLEAALQLAQTIHSTHFVRVAAGLLAVVLLRQGETERAEQVIDDALGSDTAQLTPGQRHCWYARALIYLAQEDHSSALNILDSLLSSAVHADGANIPSLISARGEALIQAGRLPEAEADLKTALETASQQGIRSLQWRTLASLATLYRLQNRREEANDAIEHARRILGDLAATVSDENRRSEFQLAAEAQLPKVRPLSTRQSLKQSFGGLTAREREVAALTVQGYTNRQIAEALFISEETATVHIKHILNKLNFTSRSQIAVWATQHNLVKPNTEE
jgi:predicted ATPase/DNA-binding CsgD family transcriptional regulator